MNKEEQLRPMTYREKRLLAEDPEAFVADSTEMELSPYDRRRLSLGWVTEEELAVIYSRRGELAW